eukprot:2183529-Pyramimonas_sp.AAC.2
MDTAPASAQRNARHASESAAISQGVHSPDTHDDTTTTHLPCASRSHAGNEQLTVLPGPLADAPPVAAGGAPGNRLARKVGVSAVKSACVWRPVAQEWSRVCVVCVCVCPSAVQLNTVTALYVRTPHGHTHTTT